MQKDCRSNPCHAVVGATHCRASWPAYRAAAGCARARPATPRRRHGPDAAVRHHHPRPRPGMRIRPARELIVRATALLSTVPASSPPGPTPGHPPLRAIRGQVRNSPSHRRLAGHVSPPQLLSAHPSLPPATLGPTDTLRIPPLKCLCSVRRPFGADVGQTHHGHRPAGVISFRDITAYIETSFSI